MKIRLVGTELFHAEVRTDMTKLMVAFRNFANVPKKSKYTLKFILLYNSAVYAKLPVTYVPGVSTSVKTQLIR